MHPEYINIGTVEGRLIEECSELILAISKATRFGRSSNNMGKNEYTNEEQVYRECNDVRRAIDNLMIEWTKE